MNLSANKFGRHNITIVQYKLKGNKVELLVLIQNCRQLRGFFYNTNICEGVSLDTKVPPQVDNGLFVLNWNFLSCCQYYWHFFHLLTVSMETWHHSIYWFQFFLQDLFEGWVKIIFGFRWVAMYLFSDLTFCVFLLLHYYPHLIFLFLSLVSPLFLFPIVSLVSFRHPPIVVICQDNYSVKYHNKYSCMIKSSRRWSGSLLYLRVTIFLPLFNGR